MRRARAMLAGALPYALLLVLAAGLVTCSGLRNRTRLYLEDPEPGDIYVARVGYFSAAEDARGRYGLLRVQDVRGRTVFVQPSRQTSQGKRGAYLSLDKAEGVAFDASRRIEIDRDQLMPLHERGVILAARHHP